MKFYNKNAGRDFKQPGTCAYKVLGGVNPDYKKLFKVAIASALILSFFALMFFTPYDGKLFADSKIKVFLDAGHGGSDPGAVWYGFHEKVANLDITLRVKSKLEANGFSVAMARAGDSAKSLDERVAMANSSGADIFVSIHNNASISPYAHGTETYWCANGVSGSSQLASLIQSNVVSSTGRANRGVKTANFRVIKYTKMPAALLEGAFMSNQTESDLLKNAEFREKMADGIYKGIKKFAEGINKASSGGSSSGGKTSDTSSTTTTTDAGKNQNTYSDTSGTNSSGFTVKVNLPENGAKLFSQFEIRGWAADLRGTPAKKLKKLEIYKAPERNEANLLGKIEDFETNVLGSEGVLNGGWSLALDVEKLSEGENILYIYAYDKDKNYSLGNLRVNAVKSGDISQINLNPIAVPGGPYSGQVNTDVKFNGTGSYDPDGIVSQYIWDFGDGSTSDAAKPVHKFTEKGTYTVTLTVKDGQGKSSATVSATAAIIDPAEETIPTDTTSGSTETGQEDSGTATFENISNSTSFTGYIDISAEALVKMFKDKNSTKTERAQKLAPLYIKYAKLFDLRADLAWAQMIHETAFLEYTGDVKPNQNNFVGIGATGGGVPGDSFATEELGVIAHFAHLAWYYFPNHVNEYCNRTYDPRHFGDSHTNYTGNTTLGFLNGRWAPGKTYTDKIILFANQIIQGISSKNKTTETTAPENSVNANAGKDIVANAGQSVTFDASGSIIKISGDTTVSYMWDWDGDGKFDQTADTAVIKHVFETAGVFEVTLRVALSDGSQSTDKINVTVNSIPAADAGGPYSAEAGKQITLDGSKSTDKDGTIKNYLWEFGDGTTGSGMRPSHVFAEPGNYTVKLTVVDDRNAPSTTVSVAVAVTAVEAETGESAASTPDTSAEETAEETEDTTKESTPESMQGDTVQVTTTEETKTSDTTAAETTAPNNAPTANAGGPYSAKVDEQITMDGSKSSDSDGQVNEYTWDFGDGSTGTGQKPSKKYTKAGTYTVSLIVKDDKGLASGVVQATATIAEKQTKPQYPVNTSIITNSTNFIGYHEVTVDQLVNVFVKKGSSQVDRARRIAPLYIQYGKLFNIRADIAWAQMIHETGFLAYTGDVKPNQNNFSGLGATGGGVPGNSFATEELGVIAQYAHLAWYYYPNHVNQYCSSTYDPRHFGNTHSKYTGNTTVGFLNGRWAPGATYTDKILLFANQIYGK